MKLLIIVTLLVTGCNAYRPDGVGPSDGEEEWYGDPCCGKCID